MDAALETILSVYACPVEDDSSPWFISVARDKLWHQAVCVYKRIKANPGLLHRQMSVEFEGEDGVDAGALRLSFSECLMLKLNEELFEGHQEKRLPKKDWGLCPLFEIAGLMVSHSLMNGGPALPCLLPAHYHILYTGNSDSIPLSDLPTVEDIPRSMAYEDLREFVQKVRI